MVFLDHHSQGFGLTEPASDHTGLVTGTLFIASCVVALLSVVSVLT
jgi:hypothetical protein